MAWPANISVYGPTNEVFIGDRYGNNRIIVFDAETGEFRHLRGVYGERRQFMGSVVHIAFWPNGELSLSLLTDNPNSLTLFIERATGVVSRPLGLFGSYAWQLNRQP